MKLELLHVRQLLLGIVAAVAFSTSAKAQIYTPQTFSIGPQPNHTGSAAPIMTWCISKAWWLGPNSSNFNVTSYGSLTGYAPYGPPVNGTSLCGGSLQLGHTTSPFNLGKTNPVPVNPSSSSSDMGSGGGGTTCLPGWNTYTGDTWMCGTGGTTINSGTLILSDANLLGDGNSISANGGDQSTGTSLTVGDQAGFSDSSESIDLGSSLTVGNPFLLPFETDSAPAAVADVSAVPEPGTISLLALAAGTLLLCPRPLRMFVRSRP
jgi:hypothetical protein